METKKPLVVLPGSYQGSFTEFAKKAEEFLKSNTEDFDSCTEIWLSTLLKSVLS